MKTYLFVMMLMMLAFITGCKKEDNISSVSGDISYNGLYTGSNTTIYVRVYTTVSKAIGTPDYIISISGPGNYVVDLDDYKGDVYLSAFMDIDNSGNVGEPTANEILTDGV